MMSRRRWNDMRMSMGLVMFAAALQACGGEQDAQDDASVTSQPPATTGGAVARADFVLCPAIEEIADELAARVGFERDLERRIAGIGKECFVRGEDAGWIRVAIPPAVIQSIAMQSGGYEGQTTPAPALGGSAVFVEAQVQPHVIFELFGQIIDVGVEHAGYGAPDRAVVMDVATMVRDALRAANDG